MIKPIKRLFHRHRWQFISGYHGRQILTGAALTIIKARCSTCPRRRRFQYIGLWTAEELGWQPPDPAINVVEVPA